MQYNTKPIGGQEVIDLMNRGVYSTVMVGLVSGIIIQQMQKHQRKLLHLLLIPVENLPRVILNLSEDDQVELIS